MTEISMWDTTSEEVAAEQTQRTSSLATAAVEPLWPFLSAAASMSEFEHRLSLAEASLVQAVSSVVSDPAGTIGMSITAGLRERFAQGQMARSAQQRFEASLRAAVAAGKPTLGDLQASAYDALGMKGWSREEDRRRLIDWIKGEISSKGYTYSQAELDEAEDENAHTACLAYDEVKGKTSSRHTAVGENGQCQQVEDGKQCTKPAGHSDPPHDFGKGEASVANPDRVRAASKTASTYCPNHGVYVGEGNQEQHDHCKTEQRKSKDSAKTAGVEDLSDDALLSEMIATQDRMGLTFDVAMRGSMDAWMSQIKAEVARRGLTGAPARRAAKTPWIDVARRVLANHSAERVDGYLLDATTASMLVQIADGLSPEKSAQFASMDISTATNFGWKILDRLKAGTSWHTRDASKVAGSPATVDIERLNSLFDAIASLFDGRKGNTTDKRTSARRTAAQTCPSCKQETATNEPVEPEEKDEDGEVVTALYCSNCDYGIEKVEKQGSREAGLYGPESTYWEMREGDRVVGGPFDSFDKANWALMRRGDNVGWHPEDGIWEVTPEDSGGFDMFMDMHRPARERSERKVGSRRTAAGPIRWTGDTHMGASYLVGLADNGNVYECYFNPNMNPTPCAWAQYGPEGDTGLGSQEARQGGFRDMAEAMQAAENHASQGPAVTALLREGAGSEPSSFLASKQAGMGVCDSCEGDTSKGCDACDGKGVKFSSVQALLDAEAAFFHAPQAPNKTPEHLMPDAVEKAAPAPQSREPMMEEPEPIIERPRQAVRKAAEAIDERLDGLTQNDDLGQGGTQPLSTRPRVMPGGGGDAVVTPAGPGAAPVAKNPEAAPVDPLMPTVGQKVQARIASLVHRIREDNPTLSVEAARALAIQTVKTYPEMVRTGSEA